MKPPSCSTSTCKHCRYFQAEGRRGGICKRFETFAAGDWTSCDFALPIFGEEWEAATDLIHLEKSFSLEFATQKSPTTITGHQSTYSEI
ncbi:hypothetical protein NIES970_10590 [[Synechococcus] sp. NIES-970]|uniref:hypothetical protein n=1 Tax=Picosynechococcus sp. NKBG15041c TaxID=1407650 RepID=UPI000427E04B|nr:hypothetical protein [Picosynechococcus sp. NKBG15041c]BAW96136.1 hypothetical protein NIES970_10590 [[Synechococcus] sp. NIES-970]